MATGVIPREEARASAKSQPVVICHVCSRVGGSRVIGVGGWWAGLTCQWWRPLFVCSLEFGFSFAPRVKKERFFKLEDDFLLINFHAPLIGLK